MKAVIILICCFIKIYIVSSAEYGECILGQCFPKSSDVKDGDIFDYIIIGAGTAGCILATRLTELKNATVLLIEAGGDPPIDSIIPALSINMHLTAVDWAYKTVNDSYSSQCLNNGQVIINRGKMLGGSGSMNWLVHTRGNQHDYNVVWNNEIGSEWQYENVLPYFKKLENVTNERILQNRGSRFYRGTSGPIKITNTDNSPNVTELYLKAFEETGIHFNNDFNAASQMGSGILDTNIYGGIRQSSLITYLNPVVKRENLFVLKNSLVTQIIIDKDKKTALGVKIQTESGEIISVYASHEVIVSAGSINTPQLLMLSGIGPRQQLNEFGIDCLKDLPSVGKNWHDHLAVPLFLYFDKEVQGVLDPEQALAEYLQNRTGRLASTSSNTVAAFISLTNETYPDYQTVILHFSKNSTDPLGVCNVTNYKEEICQNTFSSDKEISFLTMGMVRTESRGQVTLASADPTVHPNIYTGYFSNENDLIRAALAVEELVKVATTEAFKQYGATFFNLDIAECIDFTPFTFEYWKCYCLNTPTTSWHPVGTAKMGKITDAASVVDTNFKVIGMKRLRVVDASVIPTIPSADINNVVEMIAEKAADKIKKDYFCRS